MYNEQEIITECKKISENEMLNLENELFKFSDYFSSYTKIIRFSAWVTRFLANRRAIIENKKHSGTSFSKKLSYLKNSELKSLSLTLNEIEAAETKLLAHLQHSMFSGSEKDKLSSFKTSIDKNNLIVLETRIVNRNDKAGFLCPILLNNNHEIIYLLVRETHERLIHVGALTIISHLREQFWNISVRKVIKSVMKDCVTCKVQKSKYLECKTPPLPLDRVRDSIIFETVGVDFAGPVYLRGGEKAWICIFTCAVYRAVHLELASGLSVAAFLECFRRFIARHGRPHAAYTDNGTNFTGTNNAFSELDWQKIIKFCSTIQIRWYFNPPSGPWWGGWWENVIGVVKNILRKVLGKAFLSYEELTTVLCDTEAIINSRPLAFISENPDDLMPLTPSCFLQENTEIGVPDCDKLYHEKLNKRLKYTQKIISDLRQRFRSEYLGQLIAKDNKNEDDREVNVEDVVLTGDNIHERIDWPLARVTDMYKGRDEKNRVFTLKTKMVKFKDLFSDFSLKK